MSKWSHNIASKKSKSEIDARGQKFTLKTIYLGYHLVK